MSNPTTECPHGNVAARECTGCDSIENGVRWCEGEATGHVYADSDGDAGVIGGTRSFVAVEDVDLSCKCQLTDTEMQTVVDALAKAAEDDWNEPSW